MALNLYEIATSRVTEQSVDAASTVRKWIAVRSLDENAVKAAALAIAPLYHNTLPRQGVSLAPLGGGVWMCDIPYAFSPLILDAVSPDSLGPEFAFDITAGQVHITQSLWTRYRWQATDVVNDGGTPPVYARGKNLTVSTTDTLAFPGAGDTWTVTNADVGKVLLVSGVSPTSTGSFQLGAFYQVTGNVGGAWRLAGGVLPGTPGATGGMWTLVVNQGDHLNDANGTASDWHQAIGRTFDQITGTDIYAGKFEFTIKAQVAPLTMAYLRMVRNMVPLTNNAPWKTFGVGEVIYLGATGECTPGGVWVVTHHFATGQNLYAVPVSVDFSTGYPDIVIPYKGAWEYLWAGYGLKVDAAGGKVGEIPNAAYVERVYRSANFADLGLGV